VTTTHKKQRKKRSAAESGSILELQARNTREHLLDRTLIARAVPQRSAKVPFSSPCKGTRTSMSLRRMRYLTSIIFLCVASSVGAATVDDADLRSLIANLQEAAQAQSALIQSFTASIARLDAVVAEQGKALAQCGCALDGDPPKAFDRSTEARVARMLVASSSVGLTTITSRSVSSELLNVTGDLHLAGTLYWHGIPVG